MTPAELLPIIRRDFLCEELPVIGDIEQVVRWPRDFILREIGAAQREACLRQDLRHLYDDTTPEICEIAMTPGTARYDLDPRVLRIEWVRKDGGALQRVTREWMDWNVRGWAVAGAERPRRFWVEGRMVRVWPVPAIAETLQLAVWRLPLLPEPNWTDDLEWPGEQEKFGHWVAYRAFLRANADTVEVDLAKTHLALFEQAFGAAVPERVRTALLREPDTINLAPAPLRRGGREEW